MIKKNILSIALLSVLGLSHAAEVENLKTISYLNEPLRLHADVVGEGKVEFAAPTEYLRLNHPIPSYDLSIDIVESGGKRELIVTTTEAIDSPVLTLLLESYDSENRKQLFELPILLDFKPEPAEELLENSSEIMVDGVDMGSSATSNGATVVELADVPTSDNDAKDKKSSDKKSVEKVGATKASNETTKKTNASKKAVAQDKNKATADQEVKDQSKKSVVKQSTKVDEEKSQKVTTQQLSKDDQKKLQEASDALTQENNNALIKRYGPVAEGETLWSIANKVRPSNTTPQRMIDVIRKNNPSAFTASGVLRANVVLVIPGKTETVQSNFVKAQENKVSHKIRVGFIYELPEAPKVGTETAAIEVVVPKDEVDTEQVAVVAPQDEANTEQVAVVTPQDETNTEQVAVVAPQDETDAEQAEVATPRVEDSTTAEEAPEKVPARKFVYVPEPEPEPGIVELIFDNIIYIGAAAGTLLLAVLIIAMRRRKKGDDDVVEKPAKEKKAKGFGRKKKGADEDQSESADQPPRKARGPLGRKKRKDEGVVDAGVVAVATVASAEAVIENEKPADIIVETVFEESVESVGDLDFDLSSLEQVADSAIEAENIVGSGDFDLSSLESASGNVIEASSDLDFDLSSLESTSDNVMEASSDLDFDLSSLESASDNMIEASSVTEASGDLDFDVSLDDIAANVELDGKTSETDDYGDLDFDLSFEGLTEDQNSNSGVAQATTGVDELDFDLSELATTNAVDETFGATSDVGSGDEFGENNPLFSQQTLTETDGVEIVEDIGGKAPDYISFTDLMKTAETEAGVETTDESFDFSNIVDEDEAKLANLLEVSSHDAAETKLDFSFVAETEDVDASQSFLDSLDLSNDVESHVDVIGDSIKDNIAMTTESMTELSNLSSQVASLETANVEAVAPSVVETEIESAPFAEPVIVEVPEVEPVSFAEPMIVEVPEVEPVAFAEPAIVEMPEIEPVSLAEPTVDDSLDFGEINFTEEVAPVVEAKVEEITVVEPVVDANVVATTPPVTETTNIPVQERIIEKEVIVEKVVEVEKPVIVEVPVAKSEVSEEENESEQIKLELAIAYMDFDKSLAKPLLDEVIRDGNTTQISKAKNLLAQMD